MFRAFVLGAAVALGLASAARADLTIAPNNDAHMLGVTLVGPGITINSSSASGDASQFGTFTGGSSIGGGFFESGVVISTGNVASAPGPNEGDNISTGFGGAGDADLDAIVAPETTEDAAVLTLTITSTGGNVFFNYIFASEEYNEFVNSEFNDVFAFFLDGQNIALIPGTTTPVAINTVNGGGPTFGTNPSHPEFYHNNDLDDGGPFFNIEYDGFTSVFTASATGLSPGEHTLEIKIADTGDDIYDSAVFLQAGTLSGEEPGPVAPIPEPATWLMLIAGFGALGLALRRRQNPVTAARGVDAARG